MIEHVWRAPMYAQAACWCQPFLDHSAGIFYGDGSVAPMVYHRPDPGYVFHEHGEQGPMPVEYAPHYLNQESA